MSVTSLTFGAARVEKSGRPSTQLKLSWVTVALAAVVIAYIDGFWVTSLQGTVGAIERNQPPFTRWLRDSTIMLPLFVLGVVAALVLTRRWFARGRRELITLSSAALLILAITSLLSIAEVTASSIYDYHLQARDLGLRGHVHAVAVPPGTVVVADPAACTGVCSARQSTLSLHVRAVGYASMVILITNVVLVAWILAMRGGQLWARRRRAVGVAHSEERETDADELPALSGLPTVTA